MTNNRANADHSLTTPAHAEMIAATLLERDEAREQFDAHVAWASDQAARIEGQIEALGEALYLMSGPLRASGFLDNDEHHRLYEKVVAGFQEIGNPCPDCGGAGVRFDHADNCADDDCVLAGGMNDCNGQMVQCHCCPEPEIARLTAKDLAA